VKTKLSNKNFPDKRLATWRKRFVFSLLLILATALLLSACGLPSQAVTPTAQPAGKSVLPDDPLTAIIQAMKAELKAMPFRVIQTIDSGGKQLKTTVEFESLQRVLIVTPTGSFKMVDGKIYQETNGVWQEYPAGASVMAGFLSMGDEASVDAFITMINTVKLVNTETMDGQATRHYEFTYAGEQSSVQFQGTEQIWVTEVEGLPIKMVIEGESAGYKATTTSSIEYDPTISVNAP
jgi:hypothetical protein